MAREARRRKVADTRGSSGFVTTAELVLAFEHAPVGMAITAEGAVILHANDAFAALLGCRRDELRGKSMVDITHPDDVAESLALGAKLAAGEIASFSVEKRYLQASGAIVWTRVHVSALAADATARHHLVHAIDITREKAASVALEESENRFREMTEAIEQDFWIMRLDPLELLFSSPAATRLWGIDPMLNRDRPGRILRLVHAEDLATFAQLFEGDLVEPREREYRVIRVDGALRWFRTRVFPVRAEGGAVDRIAGVTEDITMRKRAEQEAEHHRGALAHAVRVGTMGRMAAGIAHELNQPLAAILNYSSACSRYLSHESIDVVRIRDVVGKIANQAMRAGKVISTLRALVSKAGGERSWHDPNEIVRAALGMVELDTQDSGAVVQMSLAPGLPAVQIDPIQIEQVLLNLVRNAIDAMSRAPSATRPRIRVVTRLARPGRVEISVADNGPGIEPDVAMRIFDEFYTTKSDGLGLGLSISRSIVEAHGGTLWLDPTTARGCTFRFTLPTPE
jgi:two-component system sensor kinase FixL